MHISEYSCNNPIISRFVARYDEIQINNLHTNSIRKNILIFALVQYE
jgi:hypothetical protein